MSSPGDAQVSVDRSEPVSRETFRRIVAGQELERGRLARELHDEIAQSLASLLVGLRTLEAELVDGTPKAAVAGLRELAVATLEDVRRLAVELRPKALDDFGLDAALEHLAQRWQAGTGIEVAFTAHLGEERLPGETATAFYRIVQEALLNVVKHAEARHVSILVTRKNENVVTVIEDDGRGFDPAVPSTGIGLDTMRERVALLGGQIRIESSPSGTTLAIELPVE
jgi:signal transduction histidine kinase